MREVLVQIPTGYLIWWLGTLDPLFKWEGAYWPEQLEGQIGQDEKGGPIVKGSQTR